MPSKKSSKISNLTQGMFVGAVSDNFDERIDQKIFHAEIVVDSTKVSAEIKVYQFHTRSHLISDK